MFRYSICIINKALEAITYRTAPPCVPYNNNFTLSISENLGQYFSSAASEILKENQTDNTSENSDHILSKETRKKKKVKFVGDEESLAEVIFLLTNAIYYLILFHSNLE